MNRLSAATLTALLALTPPPPALAQLLNKDAPVIVGHYHLNVTSIEEHKKFWVDTLGGTAIKFGPEGVDVIRFPDVLTSLKSYPRSFAFISGQEAFFSSPQRYHDKETHPCLNPAANS